MNLSTITPAQVVKAKSRLKGIGLLSKEDDALFTLFLQAIENNDVTMLKRDNLIDIWHLVQFSVYLDGNPQQIKYRNNKRIFLD